MYVNTSIERYGRAVAKAAVLRLAAGHTYDGVRVDPSSLVRVTVCFHGACSSR